MGNKRKGASVILVNPKQEVLLYLRDDKAGIPFPDCWDLPGGQVEPDESPEECIKRELLEEIELVLEGPQLFGVYDMDDRVEHTYWNGVDIRIEGTPLHEGQRLQWFTRDDVLALADNQIAFGFKPILLDFFRKQPWVTAH